MPDDVISRIHALARNQPKGITFTGRNEIETKEDDENDDYVPSNEEGIEDDGSYNPDDGSNSNIWGDYPSDDDGPGPNFGPTPNGDEKSTGSHDTTEEEDPTDKTGAGIKNETQNNTGEEIRNETPKKSKNVDEDPQNKV